MKKTILTWAMLAIGAVTFGADGSEGNSGRLAVVNDAESGKIKVIYKSDEIGKVELRLLDEEGNKLYSTSLKSSGGFILPMNFSNLEEGQYTFELTDSAGKVIERIQYGQPAAEGMQLRVTRVEESKYAVMLSRARAGKVQIRFLNDQGKVVYDLEEEISGEFGKLFTFREHPIQVSSVEVTDSRGSTTALVN